MFKDFSIKIFKFSDEQIITFIKENYRPKCTVIFEDDDSQLEIFDENIDTEDFIRFVQAVIKL